MDLAFLTVKLAVCMQMHSAPISLLDYFCPALNASKCPFTVHIVILLSVCVLLAVLFAPLHLRHCVKVYVFLLVIAVLSVCVSLFVCVHLSTVCMAVSMLCLSVLYPLYRGLGIPWHVWILDFGHHRKTHGTRQETKSDMIRSVKLYV